MVKTLFRQQIKSLKPKTEERGRKAAFVTKKRQFSSIIHFHTWHIRVSFRKASEALDSDICQLTHFSKYLDVLTTHPDFLLQNVASRHLAFHARPVVSKFLIGKLFWFRQTTLNALCNFVLFWHFWFETTFNNRHIR